jgi:hypothetical protein
LSNRVTPVGARHQIFVKLLAEMLPRQLAANRAWHNCEVQFRLAACPHCDPATLCGAVVAARGTPTRPLNGVRARKGYREVRLKRTPSLRARDWVRTGTGYCDAFPRESVWHTNGNEEFAEPRSLSSTR